MKVDNDTEVSDSNTKERKTTTKEVVLKENEDIDQYDNDDNDDDISSDDENNASIPFTASDFESIDSDDFSDTDPEAARYYESELAINCKAYGSDNWVFDKCYSNLCKVYDCLIENNRNVDDELVQLKVNEDCLAMRIKYLGPEHLDVADSYLSISYSYWSNQKSYTEAIKYCEKSLKIKLKALGPKHLDVASCYEQIGMLCSHYGEFDDAITYNKKCLEIKQNLENVRAKDLADLYDTLSMLYLQKKTSLGCKCASTFNTLSDFGQAVKVGEKKTCFETKEKCSDNARVLKICEKEAVEYYKKYTEALEKERQQLSFDSIESDDNLLKAYATLKNFYINEDDTSKAMYYEEKEKNKKIEK